MSINYEDFLPSVNYTDTVASGVVYNANTVVIPINENIEPTTPEGGFRGLRVVVATSEPIGQAPLSTADAFHGGYADIDARRPRITFSPSTPEVINPDYTYFSNGMTFSDHQSLYFQSINKNGKTYMLRGGWDYILYHERLAGCTMTVSYEHVTHTLDWLAVNVHRCYNIDQIDIRPIFNTIASGSFLIFTPSQSLYSSSYFLWWQGLKQGAMVSSVNTDNFHMYGNTDTDVWMQNHLTHADVRVGYASHSTGSVDALNLGLIPVEAGDHGMLLSSSYINRITALSRLRYISL